MAGEGLSNIPWGVVGTTTEEHYVHHCIEQSALARASTELYTFISMAHDLICGHCC